MLIGKLLIITFLHHFHGKCDFRGIILVFAVDSRLYIRVSRLEPQRQYKYIFHTVVVNKAVCLMLKYAIFLSLNKFCLNIL